jgi:hypothetical protein
VGNLHSAYNKNGSSKKNYKLFIAFDFHTPFFLDLGLKNINTIPIITNKNPSNIVIDIIPVSGLGIARYPVGGNGGIGSTTTGAGVGVGEGLGDGEGHATGVMLLETSEATLVPPVLVAVTVNV